MVEKQTTVLFGDTNLERTQVIRENLRERGIGVTASSSSKELLALAQRKCPDVIVLDDSLEIVGNQVLASLLRNHCPQARIILLLPPGSHPDREGQKHLEPVCSLVSPVSDDDLAAVITSALQDSGQNRTPVRPSVILCVDDDVLFLKSLMRILRKRGFAVIGYDNPEQALEAIPIHHPSMVFIDVLMPGMNGLDLASELREKYGDSLPLVLLSARSSDQEIAEGYKSGARYYITKPCDPDKILNIADYLVGNLEPKLRKLLGSQL